MPTHSATTYRRAFTLVEVLLVLAMLALFATLLLPGVNSMLAQIDDRGPQQLLGESVLAARLEALETGRTVDLRYDAETRQFSWGATDARAEPLPVGSVVELLPVATGASILLGGELTEVQEPLRRVRFFPDGTCEPFRIRFAESGAKPRVLLVDPWTCAVSPAPVKGGT